MKALILTLALAISACSFVYSQDKKSVVIGTMIDKPNAILVINPPNGDQGFLLPQLTSAQRVSIAPSSPVDNGLMVYDITEKSFYYWSDDLWIKGLGVKDAQVLSFDETNQLLSLSNGGGQVKLSTLKEIPPLVANQDAFLTTDGTTLKWSTISALGDITSIVAGQGLTGGGTTGDITLKLNTDGSTIGFTATDQLQLLDKAVTPAKIAPGGIDKVLTTNATGDVFWEDKSSFNNDNQGLQLAGGNVLNIDNGISANLNGLQAGGQLQGTLNNLSIVPGTPNQVLVTDAGLNVQWVNQSSLANVATDGLTLTGNGTVGTPLQVATINGSHIADGTVQNADINGDAITTDKILNESVSGADIQDGSVGVNELAPNSVSTAKILDRNVTLQKIEAGTAANQVLVTDAALSVQWVNQSTLAPNITVSTPTLAGNGTVGNPLTVGTITGAANITDGSVLNADIEDNAITTAKIDDDAVTTTKIQDHNVSPIKLQPGGANQVLITNAAGTDAQWVPQSALVPNIAVDGITITGDGAGIQLAVGNIAGSNIINESVDGDDIRDLSVSSNELANNSVDINKLAGNSVNSSKIADGTIIGDDITDSSVQPTKLQQGAPNQVLVTNGAGSQAIWVNQNTLVPNITVDPATMTGNGSTIPLAVNTITGAQITDGTVQTADLANNAVDINKLAGNTVNSSKIIDGTIIGDDITNNSVQPTKLQQGAPNQVLVTDGAGSQAIWVNQNTLVPNITVDPATMTGNGSTIPLAVNTITGAQITDGTVQTADLANNAVDINKLAGNTVNSSKIIDGTIIGDDITNNSVQPTKLQQGAPNQVLVTNGAGSQAIWVNQNTIVPNIAVSSPTLTGDGTAGNPLAVGIITSGNIQPGTIVANNMNFSGANKVLTTDATNVAWTNQGALPIAGDVTGTLAATTVARLQGRNVSNAAPTNGQTLIWNNATSTWVPGPIVPTPVTQYYAVDPVDFQGTGSPISVGIHLPDGAIVTNVKVYYQYLLLGSINTTMSRKAFATAATQNIATGASPLISLGAISDVDLSNPINNVIDNSTYSYRIQCSFTLVASSAIQGISIEYTK